MRRVRGSTLEILAFVVYTVLLPVLLLGGFVVDLALWLQRRKPWIGIRLVAFGWWFLFGEMRALAGIVGIWILTGGPFGGESLRRRRWVYDLRSHWSRSHMGGVRVLFGLRFEVEGLETVGPGPVVIMMRHASIIDNTLPDVLVAHRWGMGLRFVIKRELQMIPTIDIAGRWVPAVFVRRASEDPAGELADVRSLAHDITEGEGILIYPEGTRATQAKIARAKEIIAERQPEIAALANGLQHVLPPRLGGPLALLDEAEGVDVVFCGHVGFDGYEYVSDIWAGHLVGSTIKVRFWRHPGSAVPGDEAGRTTWLYEQWQTLDDWITDQQPPSVEKRDI